MDWMKKKHVNSIVLHSLHSFPHSSFTRRELVNWSQNTSLVHILSRLDQSMQWMTGIRERTLGTGKLVAEHVLKFPSSFFSRFCVFFSHSSDDRVLSLCLLQRVLLCGFWFRESIWTDKLILQCYCYFPLAVAWKPKSNNKVFINFIIIPL